MVEGARLESVYTVTPYRGFESLLLRHFVLASENSPKALKMLEVSGVLNFGFRM